MQINELVAISLKNFWTTRQKLKKCECFYCLDYKLKRQVLRMLCKNKKVSDKKMSNANYWNHYRGFLFW